MPSIQRYLRPILVIALFASSVDRGHSEASRPLRWGVDDAGTKGRLLTHPKGRQVMEEFGFNFLVTHHVPKPTVVENRDSIRAMDAWCRKAGVDWVANLESANFRKEHIDDQGRNWFERPDGRHFWLFPDELLKEYGKCKRLWGFMYDEAAHMQNCRNKIAGLDAPWVFDPGGSTLEGAADGFCEAVGDLERLHAKHGIRLSTEHVFPVLFHSFARARWTAGTKVLKENWSPAYIACAMGAALQYNTELWITPDLWHQGKYPGHSPDAYASALLLAYHMGADCIYTENLAYHGKGTDRPPGSLVRLTNTGYELTDHGKVAKHFGRNYIPGHPRAYTFRDVKPRVAIIRQPDACWGQSDSWLPDSLFGHKGWKSNSTTEAWLRIWHLLSRGVISDDSLSWHNRKQRRERKYQVFCPLDGVVVFDHHVGFERLDGVEVIFVTGLGVSATTQAAIEKRVKAGATCVALPQLLPARVSALIGDGDECIDGKGRWVATTDFLAAHVKQAVQHVIPAGDVIRYRFGDQVVLFEPVSGDMNKLNVTVSETRQAHQALPGDATKRAR